MSDEEDDPIWQEMTKKACGYFQVDLVGNISSCRNCHILKKYHSKMTNDGNKTIKERMAEYQQNSKKSSLHQQKAPIKQQIAIQQNDEPIFIQDPSSIRLAEYKKQKEQELQQINAKSKLLEYQESLKQQKLQKEQEIINKKAMVAKIQQQLPEPTFVASGNAAIEAMSEEPSEQNALKAQLAKEKFQKEVQGINASNAKNLYLQTLEQKKAQEQSGKIVAPITIASDVCFTSSESSLLNQVHEQQEATSEMKANKLKQQIKEEIEKSIQTSTQGDRKSVYLKSLEEKRKEDEMKKQKEKEKGRGESNVAEQQFLQSKQQEAQDQILDEEISGSDFKLQELKKQRQEELAKNRVSITQKKQEFIENVNKPKVQQKPIEVFDNSSQQETMFISGNDKDMQSDAIEDSKIKQQQIIEQRTKELAEVKTSSLAKKCTEIYESKQYQKQSSVQEEGQVKQNVKKGKHLSKYQKTLQKALEKQNREYGDGTQEKIEIRYNVKVKTFEQGKNSDLKGVQQEIVPIVVQEEQQQFSGKECIKEQDQEKANDKQKNNEIQHDLNKEVNSEQKEETLIAQKDEQLPIQQINIPQQELIHNNLPTLEYEAKVVQENDNANKYNWPANPLDDIALIMGKQEPNQEFIQYKTDQIEQQSVDQYQINQAENIKESNIQAIEDQESKYSPIIQNTQYQERRLIDEQIFLDQGQSNVPKQQCDNSQLIEQAIEHQILLNNKDQDIQQDTFFEPIQTQEMNIIENQEEIQLEQSNRQLEVNIDKQLNVNVIQPVNNIDSESNAVHLKIEGQEICKETEMEQTQQVMLIEQQNIEQIETVEKQIESQTQIEQVIDQLINAVPRLTQEQEQFYVTVDQQNTANIQPDVNDLQLLHEIVKENYELQQMIVSEPQIEQSDLKICCQQETQSEEQMIKNEKEGNIEYQPVIPIYAEEQNIQDILQLEQKNSNHQENNFLIQTQEQDIQKERQSEQDNLQQAEEFINNLEQIIKQEQIIPIQTVEEDISNKILIEEKINVEQIVVKQSGEKEISQIQQNSELELKEQIQQEVQIINPQDIQSLQSEMQEILEQQAQGHFNIEPIKVFEHDIQDERQWAEEHQQQKQDNEEQNIQQLQINPIQTVEEEIGNQPQMKEEINFEQIDIDQQQNIMAHQVEEQEISQMQQNNELEPKEQTQQEVQITNSQDIQPLQSEMQQILEEQVQVHAGQGQIDVQNEQYLS